MKILGYDYQVTAEQDVRGLDKAEYADMTRQTIQVANDMPSQSMESTLLHEIIEAINYHLEVGISEAQVKQLETGLYQTLTANGVSFLPLMKSAKINA